MAGYHVLEETLAGHSLQLRPVTDGAHPVIIAIQKEYIGRRIQGLNPPSSILLYVSKPEF